MFTNVIVGVDGEQGGRDAIALAKNLLSAGGELTVAHVHLGDPGFARDTRMALADAERERSFALLQAAANELGVEATRLSVVSSSIGRGLHELAERQNADLLVVGSCRRGLIGRVFVGDDTRAELNGAPCAVAIASAGQADQPTLHREIGVGYDGSPESGTRSRSRASSRASGAQSCRRLRRSRSRRASSPLVPAHWSRQSRTTSSGPALRSRRLAESSPMRHTASLRKSSRCTARRSISWSSARGVTGRSVDSSMEAPRRDWHARRAVPCSS